jgi:ATP-binding cassette subfamily C (CFTR/MRP) protein 1
MLGAAVFQTLILHQYFHGVMRTGMRFRAAVVTAIYRKSLRLSTSARQAKSTGTPPYHRRTHAYYLHYLSMKCVIIPPSPASQPYLRYCNGIK